MRGSVSEMIDQTLKALATEWQVPISKLKGQATMSKHTINSDNASFTLNGQPVEPYTCGDRVFKDEPERAKAAGRIIQTRVDLYVSKDASSPLEAAQRAADEAVEDLVTLGVLVKPEELSQ